MKKKVLLIFFVLTVVISSCVALTSCTRHKHVFDQQVATAQYRVSLATCTSGQKYYYSCVCSERGKEVFEMDDAKGHSYTVSLDKSYKTAYVIGETVKASDIKMLKNCSVCGKTDSVDFSLMTTAPLTANVQKVEVKVNSETTYIPVTVGEVAVQGIAIKQEENKIVYEIFGNCASDTTQENLSFELSSENGLYVYADKDAADVTLTDDADGIKKFTMVADVTNIPANEQSFYPRVYINNKAVELNDVAGKYDGINLSYDTSIYQISHASDGQENYAIPAIYRKSVATVPQDASYAPNPVLSADIVQRGDRVYYEIYGVSQGYTYETLTRELNFELRNYNASIVGGSQLFIDSTQNGPLLLDEEGNFTLIVDITELPINNTYPYYTRFGQALPSGLIADLNGNNVTAEDGKTISLGDKIYELIYRKKGNASVAYGTVGIFIKTIN